MACSTLSLLRERDWLPACSLVGRKGPGLPIPGERLALWGKWEHPPRFQPYSPWQWQQTSALQPSSPQLFVTLRRMPAKGWACPRDSRMRLLEGFPQRASWSPRLYSPLSSVPPYPNNQNYSSSETLHILPHPHTPSLLSASSCQKDSGGQEVTQAPKGVTFREQGKGASVNPSLTKGRAKSTQQPLQTGVWEGGVTVAVKHLTSQGWGKTRKEEGT